MKSVFHKNNLKFRFTLLVIVLVNLGYSQNYNINFGPTYTVNLDTNDLTYTKGVEIVNNGTVNLNITYQLTLKDTLNDCRFELCVSGICMGNLDPVGTLPLLAPGETGWLKLHFFSGYTPGINVIKYLIKNGATQADTLTWILIVNAPNGVKELSEYAASISVFPNPASDFVIVKGKKTANSEIQFYNTNGNLVLKRTLDQELTSIKTDFLAAGSYYYSIKRNGIAVKTGKIIINTE